MMGGLFTNLWWGGNPDIPNPQTGLTRRDIYHVQSSWALMYKDPVGSGCKLFIGLFTAYPENKPFFKSFKDIPNEELPKKAQFRAHVVNAMSSLNMIFEHLDQPEVVSAMMEKLAEAHIKRGIERQHFNQVKEVIFQLLKGELKLDETYLQSWEKAITFLYKFVYPRPQENI